MGALREAAIDFYYNSWRLVPANIVWGLMLLGLIGGTAVWPPVILLVGLLGLPVAGLHAMAALIARGEAVAFSDFFAGMRRHAGAALMLGYAALLLAVVFSANVFVGLEMGGLFGLVFSAFALYGDIGLAMFLVAAWPLLVDPVRANLPMRRRLWLAVVVNFARPARMAVLAAIIGALLLVSAFLFAALVTVTVAYVSLVASRYVLPAADRLEGRTTVLREG